MKPIQITVAVKEQETSMADRNSIYNTLSVYALCDDGSVWELADTDNPNKGWERLPAVAERSKTE